MEYKEKGFEIPELNGISAKQMEIHLALYAGYVKHVNLIRKKIQEFKGEDYVTAELRRRFSFEFNGMRMHEYYFEQFEGGPKVANINLPLGQALLEKYASWDGFIDHFKAVGMSRGIGWAVLYFDPVGNSPHVAWTSDHELGTLAGLPIILAMDMWEHAFMVDYMPRDKGKYIDAFLSNVNWSVAEERFNKVI
jgi:superoxide dismutase, Fe-Mn family